MCTGKISFVERLVLPVVSHLLKMSFGDKKAFALWAVLTKFIYSFLSNVIKGGNCGSTEEWLRPMSSSRP